jgi:hypothetical protein
VFPTVRNKRSEYKEGSDFVTVRTLEIISRYTLKQNETALVVARHLIAFLTEGAENDFLWFHIRFLSSHVRLQDK